MIIHENAQDDLLLDSCKFYQYHVWHDLEESKIDRIEENHCINSFFDSKLNFCQSNKALHILAKKPSLKELMEASKTYCNHRCGCHRNRQTELRVQEHLGLIPIRVPNMTLVAYCYLCLSDSRTCEEDNLLNVIDECYQSENNHAKVNVKNT